jgi:hypothetical protein
MHEENTKFGEGLLLFLHSEKAIVWCDVSAFLFVAGPYLFGDNIQAITACAERYCTVLQTFMATELQRIRQKV